MKKVQRSFAIEYKSGRRKNEAKPNSIWGNMDLKSVARDVEESAMPFLRDNPTNDESDMKESLLKANRVLPTLTPPVATLTTAADTQEMFMVDDTDTIINADAPANAEMPVATKKQRKPRAKKASPEMGPKKRGREVKVIEGTAVAKRTPLKRAPKAEQIATIVSTTAGEEMADLLQLEEENQKLRKLLADKLRSENADLRKKLNLD